MITENLLPLLPLVKASGIMPSMTVEQGSFLAVDLQAAEMAEIEGMPHAELLAKAFQALTQELDTNGNTERFAQIRQRYSRKLIAFWAMKRSAYMRAREEGLIREGEVLQTGDERLTIQKIGEMDRDDDMSLLIVRETPLEKDDVSVTINGERGIDYFLRPPHIKSEIRTESTDAPNLIYEVSFHNKFISTFSRLVVHEDPENQRPYIKDMREIDCSIFGIDLAAEKAIIQCL